METKTVYFVGAGPGDPELITVKGKRKIEEADVIIYAGSLVNPQVLAGAKPEAQIYNSASMTLPEVIAVIKDGAEQGKQVVRVHTGDPSIYGAIREQMTELDRLGIPYEVVPGVSSFLAAAAALKREYTLPGISQTVILTRMEGRTPVPEKETIEELASHQATMVIFLSVGQIEELCSRLVSGGYAGDTPAAVVYKASWEDQQIVTGTLEDIAGKVKAAGIRKTALVTVGRFLGDAFELSRLYDESFSHEYRAGRKMEAKEDELGSEAEKRETGAGGTEAEKRETGEERTDTEMKIRNGSMEDLEAVTAVEAECFPLAEAAKKEDFQARLSVYPNHFWLLFEGSRLIGFVNGMVTDEADLTDEMYENAAMHREDGSWQMIFGVNTIPARRRKGCAERLLRQVIADAKAQGRDGLVLTCKDRLIHYYAKFGFVNEGISRSVHGNAVWYQMRLTFRDQEF